MVKLSLAVQSVTLLLGFSAYALFLLWILRCHKLTYRSLQRLLGFLQWLLAPSSLYSTFLASSYKLLLQPSLPPILPRAIWVSLLIACLGALCPLRSRSLPPPLCMPLMYCDAAPFSTFFLSGCVRPFSFAMAVACPAWISSQQGAELYAIFSCARQAVLRGLSHVCIITDNEAAYHTVLSGRVGAARHWDRIRILRRINRLCITSELHLQIALTPSKANAADAFSRFPTHSPQTPTVLSFPLLLHPPCVRRASVVTRFWWSF